MHRVSSDFEPGAPKPTLVIFKGANSFWVITWRDAEKDRGILNLGRCI